MTGSQPAVAVKPLSQHIGIVVSVSYKAKQLLLPDIISLKYCDVAVYSIGFKNPTVDNPVLALAALTNEIIPANTLTDAAVP